MWTRGCEPDATNCIQPTDALGLASTFKLFAAISKSRAFYIQLQISSFSWKNRNLAIQGNWLPLFDGQQLSDLSRSPHGAGHWMTCVPGLCLCVLSVKWKVVCLHQQINFISKYFRNSKKKESVSSWKWKKYSCELNVHTKYVGSKEYVMKPIWPASLTPVTWRDPWASVFLISPPDFRWRSHA